MQKNILKSIIYFLLPTKNQGLKGRVRKIKKRNFPLLGLDLRVRKGPPPRLDMEKFWNTNFSINKSGKCSLLTPILFFHFLILPFRKGFKKNYVKFQTRGGQRGSFSTSNFFIFFAPNGLKIIFRH